MATLHYFDVLKLTRLRVHKSYSSMPAAKLRYNEDRKKFIENNSRDVHNDFSIVKDVDHPEDFWLVYNPDAGAAPWFTDSSILFFLDIIMLGWIQRYKFMKSVCKIEFELRKTFID